MEKIVLWAINKFIKLRNKSVNIEDYEDTVDSLPAYGIFWAPTGNNHHLAHFCREAVISFGLKDGTQAWNLDLIS